MAGGRARHLLWPACHGTRGGWKPCGRLTARQPGLSPLGQRVRLERTPGPAARARPGPGTRSRMLTGPSTLVPVPAGGHGRSAIVLVTLRGSPRWACPRAGVTASLSEAAVDPAGLVRRRAPGPQPGRRALAPAPGPAPGSVPEKPAPSHSSPGRLIRSNTTSSQSGPARASPASQRVEPGTAGGGPDGGVIAVARGADSGTSIRQKCARSLFPAATSPLPGGRARRTAPGLARKPQLAVAAGGGHRRCHGPQRSGRPRRRQRRR